MQSKKNVILAILNLIAYIGVLIVNALANLLPINDMPTGEVSDRYPNLFVPAGFTFSIWGVIYLLLGIYIIYQMAVAFKGGQQAERLFGRISVLFILSSIFNMSWIFAWHYEVIWGSLAIMVFLLLSLIFIYMRLEIGKSDALASEKYMAHLPFSVYLGWITIATIANVTAFLVDIGWDGFGISDQAWTVIVMAVGIIITLAILFDRNDIFYSLVIIWSFYGILSNRMADPETADLSIRITAIVGMAIIAIAIIIQLIRNKKPY